MNLTDTHCHIHSVDYPVAIDDVWAHCAQAGVTRLICVGENAADSQRAVDFVGTRDNCWASVGQHPHEAKEGREPLEKLRALVQLDQSGRRRSLPSSPSTVSQPGASEAKSSDARAGETTNGGEEASEGIAWNTPGAPSNTTPPVDSRRESTFSLLDAKLEGSARSEQKWARVFGATAPSPPSSGTVGEVSGGTGLPVGSAEGGERRQGKIVAIGECGLDYFYGHSSKQDQETALRYQIELALEYDLPMIFHVRDAFDDFWPIFDQYQGLRGVLHSFTDNMSNLDKALARGLYIGVNGIMTFTKNDWQLEVARAIPADKLLLETDAPFLTPAPMRGKVNEPAHVLLTAQFMSRLRQMSLSQLAEQTTANAQQLFSL